MKLSKKDLRKRWGTTTLDELALDMYDSFHGHRQGDRAGWTLYEKDDDEVVQEFRKAAWIVMWSWDKKIGSMYEF
jgi:hypothetical protein